MWKGRERKQESVEIGKRTLMEEYENRERRRSGTDIYYQSGISFWSQFDK